MTTTKKPRLTWRKEPNEEGLSSIGQRPRGYELRCQGERLGGVYPLTNRSDRYNICGYYCAGRWDEKGVPHINTASQPVQTTDEAKKILMDHFRKHLDG
jgi:hypothetical protein